MDHQRTIIISAIDQAKKFLLENPTETKTTAARIFNVKPGTLNASIHRHSESKKGGQNRILGEAETRAIHEFIRSLLVFGILPTSEVVFSAIVGLKHAQDPSSSGPSRRWYRGWWQQSGLHKNQTKPLPMVRYEAATELDIAEWFRNYTKEMKKLGIKTRRNIINFDEGGFRAGCLRGQEILVPDDMPEFYSTNPENRRSLTILEMINAAGDYPPPPFVIVGGYQLMASWFDEDLPPGTRIVVSESGFTNDNIAVEFLKHYIANSDAGPDADWKILLMDNHGSHMTPEFSLLANENHIRPFTFIPHLTHVM